MDFVTLIIIAIGLSFDNFAVSVTTGITVSHIKFMQSIKIAFTFATFHVIMPLIGWMLGKQVEHLISSYDHWVAFGLLSFLGFKMIYESFKKDEENNFNILNTAVLISIATATSIDALVVGISFALINMNIYWSIAIIGIISFIVSLIGISFGKKVGNTLGLKMEFIGGLILIGIGLKILISHIM